jgi:hypothetical protein
MSDLYEVANTLWPAVVPAITREEAKRAVARLWRKFTPATHHHRGSGYYRVRRCWISPRPTNRLDRGWRRLVHDVSHRVNLILYPHATGHRHHNGQHAELETDMVKFVLASGWLEGKLRPKVKVKARPFDSDKVASLQARLAVWDSKRRRAENAIKKLKLRLRYYERKVAHEKIA